MWICGARIFVGCLGLSLGSFIPSNVSAPSKRMNRVDLVFSIFIDATAINRTSTSQQSNSLVEVGPPFTLRQYVATPYGTTTAETRSSSLYMIHARSLAFL